jgi:DNA repair exonuclease SbcCD nuclease subunit
LGRASANEVPAVDRFEVISRLIDLANEESVDAVLCVGNLFARETPVESAFRELVELFRQRRTFDGPLIVVPGPRDVQVLRTLEHAVGSFARTPPWITVALTHTEIELKPGFIVCARPLAAEAMQATASSAARPFRIGVQPSVHGLEKADLRIAGGTSRYIENVDGSPLVRPGPPELWATQVNQSRGAVAVVSVDADRRVSVNRREIGLWRWETVEIESIHALRELLDQSDFAKRSLRLRVRLTLDAPALEAAQQAMKRLKEAVAAAGGFLEILTERFELDVSELDAWVNTLPPALAGAANALREKASVEATSAAARRALFHLYCSTQRAPDAAD